MNITLIAVNRVRFHRPNTDKVEIGLCVFQDNKHMIIIDSDFNIVCNCSIISYIDRDNIYQL